MKRQPFRIAFYGKGGIGKTTVAANISALFAKSGKRTLHIGCDPKADSTRLLTSRRIPSILRQLGERDALTREDMLFTGVYGVQCVEAGGPEAGSGCAGLGITTAVEELQRAGVFDEAWDVIVYDVLGDVVCGGFSVPMRSHYADRVYVVTSANYMSLYAANNILKGVARHSRDGEFLFGGFLWNHIRDARDEKIAAAFMERTGGGALLSLEEDSRIACADFQGKLFTQVCPDSENAQRIRAAAARMQEEKSGGNPRPLDEEELERFGRQMAKERYGKDTD